MNNQQENLGMELKREHLYISKDFLKSIVIPIYSEHYYSNKELLSKEFIKDITSIELFCYNTLDDKYIFGFVSGFAYSQIFPRKREKKMQIP